MGGRLVDVTMEGPGYPFEDSGRLKFSQDPNNNSEEAGIGWDWPGGDIRKDRDVHNCLNRVWEMCC